MRVRAYFPVAVVPSDEDGKILDNLDVMDLADDYLLEQTHQLHDMIANNSPQELIIHRLFPEMSERALRQMSKQTLDVAQVIKNRVQKNY